MTLTQLFDTFTRERRTIAISSRLAAILALRTHGPDGEPHPPSAFVFGNEIGQQIEDVSRAWETAVLKSHRHTPSYTENRALTGEARAVMEAIDLHFHDLRREWSRSLEGRVPLHTIRDWLGHTTIAQRSTYLAGTVQKQTNAMRQYEAHRAFVQQSATDSGDRGQKTTQSAITPHEKINKDAVGREAH